MKRQENTKRQKTFSKNPQPMMSSGAVQRTAGDEVAVPWMPRAANTL
jgi:hypothetical protein